VPPDFDAPLRDLTVYLLKEQFSKAADAIGHPERSRLFTITASSGASTVGHLYVKAPRSHPPRWADFFDGYVDLSELGRVSSTAAVLLVKARGRLLAITFGQGRFIMVPDCWEERFGLRVALNSIPPDRLKSLDKRTFDAISTHSRVQGTREGSAFEFGVDIDQDLVRAVTGTPDDAALGHKLSGMDALHCSVRVTVEGLKALLRTYVDKNSDDSYKRRFPWIDHIADVSDKALIAELDALLVDTINGDRERCWLCVPEIIDWNRTGGFRYAFTLRAPIFHDLRFDDFLDTLDDADVDIHMLRRRRAHCVDNEGRALEDWSIYRCIYGELELRGRTYVLSTGRWYRVETDFVTAVNAHFDQLPRYATPLPEYDDASEAHYCVRVARESPATYALMDQKMIQIGGAHGQVEFCDLFTSTKDLLHLKRYGASSVLSHLFSQGLVSGEAFRSDSAFRTQAADLLPEPFRSFSGDQPLKPEEYQFVFGAISEKSGSLRLPFFSRVNIRQATRRLQAFGYRTALAKIQVTDARTKLKRFAPR